MGSDLPRSIAKRQQWRPHGLASAESLTALLGRRRSVFLERSQRLSAWYDRLFRRVRPFQGWTPLPLEITLPVRDGMPHSSSRAGLTGRPLFARAEGDRRHDRQVSRLPIRSPIRLAVLGAVREDFAAETENAHHPAVATVAGPALALVPQAARSRREVRGGFPMSANPIPGFAAPAIPATRTTEPLRSSIEQAQLARSKRSASEVRTVSRVSVPALPAMPIVPSMSVIPPQHREIPGSDPSLEPATPRPGSLVEQLRPSTGETGTVPRTSVPPLPVTSTASSMPAIPPPHQEISGYGRSLEPATSQPRNVVEQLVDQMVFPTLVPGLELRLVRRDEPPAPPEPSSSPGRDTPSAVHPHGLANAPPQPPAPAIDVNAIADKVYRRLVRNQQRARERKGLY